MTECLKTPRWSRAEWLELQYYNKFPLNDPRFREPVVDADLPLLRRLAIRGMHLSESVTPPRRLLSGPELRHLRLLLDVSMHNYRATMVHVHDMVRACGDRLVTLSLYGLVGVTNIHQAISAYAVDPRIETATLRHPLPENRRLLLAAYGWDTVRMPRLERLELGAQFGWLSLDAPRVTHATVCEGPGCLYTDDMQPAVVRTLSAAAATLRDLRWIMHDRVMRNVGARRIATCLARFTGLERLALKNVNKDLGAFVRHAPAGIGSMCIETNDYTTDMTIKGLRARDTKHLNMDTLVVQTPVLVEEDIQTVMDAFGTRARTVQFQYSKSLVDDDTGTDSAAVQVTRAMAVMYKDRVSFLERPDELW